MNYYNDIKNKLIDDEIYAKVKDYSKERHKLETYYEVGRMLSIAGKKYGEDIIGKYSERLQKEIGKKYNKRTLFRIRQFYNVFSNEKVSTVWTQLTWSHIRLLLGFDHNKINYYIQTSLIEHVSIKKLEEKIKSCEYERLPEIAKDKLLTNEKNIITDYIKNPIIIKDNYKNEKITEKVLHNLILENITDFMKELVPGYSFVDSEYKIKIGDSYNYIDLLLFNIKYSCYVVIELKIVPLKKNILVK